MMEESITGVVEHIIFRNEENGYTVFTMECADGEETCVGFFAELSEGLSIRAFGRHVDHASYGPQFKADRYEYHAPETAEAMEAYLGSGAVKGIGRTLAKRIVERFGEESIRILEEDPERLAEVRGISVRKAREIGAGAAEQADMRRAMIFLGEYGVSLKLGVRIYREYGEEMYAVLRENPYRLAEDIEGVGFVTADRLAARIGIPPDSAFRIRSGLLYVLSNAAGEGSVCLPEELLVRRAADLLQSGGEPVREALGDLIMEHRAVAKRVGETRLIYSGKMYRMELSSARMLLDLNIRTGETEEEVLRELRQMSETGGITLAKEQERAVVLAAMHGVFLLTGGPGTGKTTAINEMIRYFRRRGMSVLLAAPTGRAARRITETTGYAASTIHRLLEISGGVDDEGGETHFERNAEHPLEADAVIIDETSMVDLPLMYALLSAIPVGTRLILAGDVDQLPSVGPGAVMRDILSTGRFPCVRLTRIFRQAAESDIVVNAHRINAGEQISLSNKSRDFFFLRRDDPNRIISNTIELIRDRLPSYVKARPFDIQVLTPMRKGSLGSVRLNGILQDYLNPPGSGKREKQFGDRLFRTGDKVMQVKNNYSLTWEVRGRRGIPVDEGSGIFNGDMGVIREIDEAGRVMTIEFDDLRTVEYPFSGIEDLELAYAVTIHKSQGSEYPAVIIPLLSGPRLLMTRNLLYTAVTRARSCVVLLGSEEAVRQMIENESDEKRFTTLDTRIAELCGYGMSEE